MLFFSLLYAAPFFNLCCLRFFYAQHLVAVFDDCGAVCHEYKCFACLAACETVQHLLLGLFVEGRCHLVEYENAAGAQDRACNGYALCLPFADTAAAFTLFSIQTAIHLLHKLPGAGDF